VSEESNSELESYSNEIARLTKLLATREATSRFLVDSAKERERRARADEKIAEAEEYVWRDKCDRQSILLRECLSSVSFNISVYSSMLISGTFEHKSIHELKIKRSELEALRENIEKELNYAKDVGGG
jgi:hypothetical protein